MKNLKIDRKHRSGSVRLVTTFADDVAIRFQLAKRIGCNASAIRLMLCDDGSALFTY